MRLYKLRHVGAGYSLGVPAELAKVIPHDTRFECELTEEGILYRPAATEPKADEMPAWLRALTDS